MPSRRRAVPESGNCRQRSSTCSIRSWYFASRSFIRAGSILVVAGHRAHGLQLGLRALLHQDLHLLLRGLERGLAVAGEGDSAFEGLERFIERQVAALQALHEALELGEGLFEIGLLRRIFGWRGHGGHS